jgi:hypothetical protein
MIVKVFIIAQFLGLYRGNMNSLSIQATKRFINALVGSAKLSYEETSTHGTASPTMSKVVMPQFDVTWDEDATTQWFSALLDEVYFRMPFMQDDFTKLCANAGEGKENIQVIHGDILRQKAQKVRQGKLLGADEYAARGHELRHVLTDNPRVNAWNAFDAECSRQIGLYPSNLGMLDSLDAESHALYEKLTEELHNDYTSTNRTPEQNYSIAQRACEILFQEEHQDQQQVGSSDDTGGAQEPSEGGSKGLGEDTPSRPEQEVSEVVGDSCVKWSRFDRDKALHKVGQNQTINMPSGGTGVYTDPITVLRPDPTTVNPHRMRLVEEQLTFSLSNQIRNHLKVLSQARYLGGKKRGRINKRRLATVPQGNERVFRTKEVKEILDTAVMLLVDSSGSMSGTRYTCATTATIELCNVLQSIGIAHSVLGFTDDGAASVIYEHKNFNERVDILSSMCSSTTALGGNSDGNSLLYAADKLMQQKQKRKVMIVLSDGQPMDGRSPVALLKKVASDLDKSKSIDLYSIGIGTDSVKHFYENTSVIEDAVQLEDALLTLLKQSLT